MIIRAFEKYLLNVFSLILKPAKSLASLHISTMEKEAPGKMEFSFLGNCCWRISKHKISLQITLTFHVRQNVELNCYRHYCQIEKNWIYICHKTTKIILDAVLVKLKKLIFVRGYTIGTDDRWVFVRDWGICWCQLIIRKFLNFT